MIKQAAPVQPPKIPQHRNWWVISLLVAIVIVATGSGIIGAWQVRRNTGTVVIKPASQNDQISLGQANSPTRPIGSGSTTLRLQPGTYQVTAAGKEGGSSRRVVVTKGTTSTLELASSRDVPMQKIANYHAQYLYAKDDTLYFLNREDGIPYTYKLGGDAARPYMASVNNVRSMHWLGPGELVAERYGGKWARVKDEQLLPMDFKDKAPGSDSASFNKDGALAFVSSGKKIFSAIGIDGELQPIGEVKHAAAKVSMAPNGNMLVYMPRLNEHDDPEPTRLYRQGTFTPLGEQLNGINNVAWNPDSNAFSYTTLQGSFIYNLDTKSSRHMLAAQPTHPASTMWTSPTTLIYADSGAIWSYDTTKDISSRLASMEGDLHGNAPFHLTDDSKTIYFSTASSQDGKRGAIYSFMPGFHDMSKEEQDAATSQQTAHTQRPKTYVGLDQLIEQGLTPDQVQAVKFALGEFDGTNAKAANVITLREFKTKLTRGQDYEVSFKLNVNGTTTYNARLEVSDISIVRLFILDERTDRQLFDSGPIKTM